MQRKAILGTGFFYATTDKGDRNHLNVIQALPDIIVFNSDPDEMLRLFCP